MNWYAIYTKLRREDSAARLINNAGIETFSPKIKINRYIREKFTYVIEPLFPSYIFALFDQEKQSHMIKYTRGVKYIVGKDNPSIVYPEIIDAIRERMQGDVIIPDPEHLKKGDRVLIKEGPFKNLYGIFEGNIPGRERAMILLDALQCKLNIYNRAIKKA